MFSKGVEAAIRDAIERGEFDRLPGAGKRIDLSAYFETPEDLRLAYSVLKNSGMFPEEVELVQQINDLEEQTKLAANESERLAATRRLRELQLKLNVLKDGRKRKPHEK